MFKCFLCSVISRRNKNQFFCFLMTPLGDTYSCLSSIQISLASLVALPCRLFYGVSLRISFKSEIDFMRSKYVSASKVAKKKMKKCSAQVTLILKM